MIFEVLVIQSWLNHQEIHNQESWLLDRSRIDRSNSSAPENGSKIIKNAQIFT